MKNKKKRERYLKKNPISDYRKPRKENLVGRGPEQLSIQRISKEILIFWCI